VEKTQVFKKRPKMRIEVNVKLKDMDIEWCNEATYLGVKMDKKLTWGSHIEYARQKARATKAKLYQDIEAGTSEQSDAHQVSSSTAPDLQIAPEETPSCGKHCAQDSGGRPMVRQKRGHSARFEVHHRNGKDQMKIFQKAESSENHCEKQ